MANKFFECACGKVHCEIKHAWECRQCKNLINPIDYVKRVVIDLCDRTEVYPRFEKPYGESIIPKDWIQPTLGDIFRNAK